MSVSREMTCALLIEEWLSQVLVARDAEGVALDAPINMTVFNALALALQKELLHRPEWTEADRAEGSPLQVHATPDLAHWLALSPTHPRHRRFIVRFSSPDLQLIDNQEFEQRTFLKRDERYWLKDDPTYVGHSNGRPHHMQVDKSETPVWVPDIWRNPDYEPGGKYSR